MTADPAAVPLAGLQHVGVPYDTPESLVAAAGPRVAEALAVGADVYLGVDRRTARGFREWLGAAGDQVRYPSPARWLREPARDLREIARLGRSVLVLGQYSATGVGAGQTVHEDGINLVLADLPLTLLCACADDSTPEVLTALRDGHPQLLVDGVAIPNPDYREPVSSSPVSASLWGMPRVRLDFRAPDDFRRVREHVTRAAETFGLRGDLLREAVLATHEAAVLAAGGTGRGVSCVLEVRADHGALHCEILGPRAALDAAATSERMRIVRMFCDRALLHDGADARTVRVLRT